MTEVRVRAMRLDKGSPVALRDTLTVLDLAIDFDQSPEDICAGLRALITDATNTGRWTRRRPPHGNGDDGPGPN